MTIPFASVPFESFKRIDLVELSEIPAIRFGLRDFPELLVPPHGHEALVPTIQRYLLSALVFVTVQSKYNEKIIEGLSLPISATPSVWTLEDHNRFDLFFKWVKEFRDTTFQRLVRRYSSNNENAHELARNTRWIWADTLTRDFVKQFQGTHTGPDGAFLKPDGIVGPRTLFALKNPSEKLSVDVTDPQTQVIPPQMPPGFRIRRVICDFAAFEFNRNVAENPNGSNRGERIDLYTGVTGDKAGPPWCGLFAQFVVRSGYQRILTENEVHGPFETDLFGDAEINSMAETHPNFEALCKLSLGSVRRAISHAKKLEMFVPNDGKYIPLPGDLCCFQFGGGKGHISVVIRVDISTYIDAANRIASGVEKRFDYVVNTIGGNENNRVRFSKRKLDAKCVGFIVPTKLPVLPIEMVKGFGNALSPDFHVECRLLEASQVATNATNTR